MSGVLCMLREPILKCGRMLGDVVDVMGESTSVTAGMSTTEALCVGVEHLPAGGPFLMAAIRL